MMTNTTEKRPPPRNISSIFCLGLIDNARYITQNSTWMGAKPTPLCKPCAHSFLSHKSLQQAEVCASAWGTHIFNRTLTDAGGMHVSSGPCARSLSKGSTWDLQHPTEASTAWGSGESSCLCLHTLCLFLQRARPLPTWE